MMGPPSKPNLIPEVILLFKDIIKEKKISAAEIEKVFIF